MEELSYEQQMKRLEEIVAKLEDGSLGLDESLKLFEEGTKLAAECNKVLNNAEQKIIKLSGEEEQ
ncbi:MAG: exodeoxyribonuclease VII small subunit [Clostridia bacterium]|jgi:exodeoxyribonuclease VII small subunit|nr:exodeoxyribonuclease VII small subunit [Clostridia bacterium]MCR4748089.1 exodeoxyribonuclease VII small subunit [Clostridiales bacterium]MBQ1895720.1 exodeoxyribonuclease VII small subunit [Clostridia bacterium]MBQ2091857.1 exodeoxyribonuclease VII small subunit [Clostridia bacterium]MBQ2500341.1 exodeoxyribonuclease VII small subunit [Clostridia bacterium]